MSDAVRVVRLDGSVPPPLVAAARDELLDRVTPDRDAKFRWGYVLGIDEPDQAGLTAAGELERTLRRELVRPIEAETGRTYDLSFLKATIGEPPDVAEGALYGGYHLDTHPDVDGDGGFELARVLVNLAPTARLLRFTRVDRWELARRGHPVERSSYQVVELPPSVPDDVIEIPPPKPGAVFGVRFWASIVPHVGVERPEGHFLASYEAVAPYPGIP